MTPERWRRINELFESALQQPAVERERWLRAACGEDTDLYDEVARLLLHDEQAGRDDFLSPRDRSYSASRFRDNDSQGSPLIDPAETLSAPGATVTVSSGRGFTPKAAIAKSRRPSVTQAQSAERARLCSLAMLFALMTGMMLVWKLFVIHDGNAGLTGLMGGTGLILLGFYGSLWTGWSFSSMQLRAGEWGMLGLFAVMLAATQYQLMRGCLLRQDYATATLVMKNAVQWASVLILIYGFFAPRESWRRATAVLVLLAVLPFGTLFLLAVRHQETFTWLIRAMPVSKVVPLELFCFDLMLLAMLAVGAAYGVRTVSRLSEQVTEAKQFGQYRLGRRIGTGGMGEVYLAEHQLLKRPCALKLIRPECLADEKSVERFEREVRITATLSCRNIIEVFDYGQTESGIYFYVMEYLPSLTFAELVSRYGPLPPSRVVYLVRQICQALRQAHAAGLIHRDIKPANILVARVGIHHDVAKLLDFGLVRSVSGGDDPRLTRDGGIVGTPTFMAPEQAKGDPALDERSDLYSLGAVAYFLLTGRPPFERDTTLGVLLALTNEPVLPPSRIQGGIPSDLEQVVLRCLAKDPADRYHNAVELDSALAACGCAEEWGPSQAQRWWSDLPLAGSPALTEAVA